MQTRLIYNPTAGPRNVHRALRRVIGALERQGWSVDLKTTARPGDCIQLARAAADAGFDVCTIAGGDGTVNEAVNGLVGTQTAMAVLPVGTGNMWAKQLGVPTYTLANPMRLHEAASGLAKGRMHSVDVGLANDRYFLCAAGIGLDAEVTSEMEPRQRHTKRLGVLPYAMAAVMIARDFSGVRTRVELDDGIIRGRSLLVLVSNIQQYCGKLHVIQEARIDDGLLDVFVFKGLGLQYLARHLVKMASRRYLEDPRIVHRQARRLHVVTEPETPVQLDGDPFGRTPITLSAAPRSLRVLVPPTAPAALFSSDGPES
jgi:YegS/Rv2252/BmrU family lipid kinase